MTDTNATGPADEIVDARESLLDAQETLDNLRYTAELLADASCHDVPRESVARGLMKLAEVARNHIEIAIGALDHAEATS